MPKQWNHIINGAARFGILTRDHEVQVFWGYYTLWCGLWQLTWC